MLTRWFILFVLCFFSVGSAAYATSVQDDSTEQVTLAVVRVHFRDFSKEEEALVRRALYDRLNDSRLILLKENEVRAALTAEGMRILDLSNEHAYLEAGRRIGFDFLLVGELDKIGDFVEVDFRLYSVSKQSELVYPEGKTFELLVNEEIPSIIESIHRDMGLEPLPDGQLAVGKGRAGKTWLWVAAGGAATGVVFAILRDGSSDELDGDAGLPRPPVVP